MKIHFRILSYWRVGTGRTLGGALDAICARDADDLPYIPGRQVRGLFREAVTDATQLNWISGSEVDLFGEGLPIEGDEVQSGTKPGTLRFESARMLIADRRALSNHRDLVSRLFLTKRSTAIDPTTNNALSNSLRFEEVAIPLKLETEVTALDRAPADWADRLEKAAPLIRAIGSGKTRGLGRTIVYCQPSGLYNA